MANIFDILADSSITVKNNMYISWGYIIYQASLMISSVLGPATVVMMVSQSYSYIFNWTATVGLIVSLVPVIIYIILCYTTSQDTQVWLRPRAAASNRSRLPLAAVERSGKGFAWLRGLNETVNDLVPNQALKMMSFSHLKFCWSMFHPQFFYNLKRIRLLIN